MRIAVSGSHSTGKSTLIGAFAAQRPEFSCEPEAFEVLGDEMVILDSEGPDLEGLAALLDYTVDVLTHYSPGDSVIFERSPADYLAYAAAGPTIPAVRRAEFIEASADRLRHAMGGLELIVLLPVADGAGIGPRPGEDDAFRRRVDDALRDVLIADDYDLFTGRDAPRVVELSPRPDEQLAELLRYTAG